MIKKEGNFFEEHIEKIILIATGAVCIVLLMMFVIFNPTKVTYDKKEFSPSEIDKYIYDEQAKELDYRLNEAPNKRESYQSQADDFNRWLALAIDIKDEIYPPLPFNLQDVGAQPKYALPQMGELEDVSADVISTVAYVPKTAITEQNVYSQFNSEPQDIDFVTVEAKLEVKGLYEQFRERFAGADVKDEWRDKSLAEPVFAAVHLQRQQEYEDGSWSDWEDVPRSRIDSRRDMFEIIEDVESLPPGGIQVRVLNYKDTDAQIGLLQPEAYRIASAKEEWFPPTLYQQYKKYQEELTRLERAESRTTESSGRRGRGGREETVDTLYEEMRKRGYTTDTTNRAQSAKRQEITKSIDALYKSFDKLLITEKTDLSKLEEPLLIWALDDTVEPKKRYRYRIRLGVFNPIAGTDKFADENDPKKNSVILWSNFSEAPDVAEVPGRLYFFARDIREAEKNVTVTVCRRTLGHWYSNDFKVKPGEIIGKVMELEKPKADEAESYTLGPAQQIGMGTMAGGLLGGGVLTPEIVDYSTGAVLIDTLDVNDWSGGATLYPRYYTDMLYSYDGAEIERMAIKQRYWPIELQVLFNEIRKSEKEPKETVRLWADRRQMRGRPVVPEQQLENREMFAPGAIQRLLYERMQSTQYDN